jgi:hypothetical protein
VPLLLQHHSGGGDPMPSLHIAVPGGRVNMNCNDDLGLSGPAAGEEAWLADVIKVGKNEANYDPPAWVVSQVMNIFTE